MTCERGVGYRSADRNNKGEGSGSSRSTRSLPPVRKVAYTVGSTQVGQMTNFDRLVLDVHTDGSVSASEALSSAGKTLGELI